MDFCFIKNIILKKTNKNTFFSQKKKKIVINLNCGRCEVDNWQVSDFIIKKLVPLIGVRPYPLNELQLMVSAVCFSEPSHIFDWGTHVGKSARIFYETVQMFSLKTRIITIDLPEDVKHMEHPHSDRGLYIKEIKEIKQLIGDGLDESLRIVKKNRSKIKPLFFLDGDHSFKSVYKELSQIINTCSQSNILIHDTFYQTEKSGYNIGPCLAIEKTLRQNKGKYLRIDTETGLPGMTLIYPYKIIDGGK